MATLSGLRHVVAQTLPRLVYGNDAGLANNRRGRSALRQARRAFPTATADRAAHQRAGRVRSEGWVALPPVPPTVLDAIRSGYEQVIEDPAATHDMGGTRPDCVRYVVDPVARVPAVAQLLQPALLDTLTAYYRSPVTLQHVRMWRIGHLPPEERDRDHYGNVWHTDHHRTSMLKVFVQVTPDVTADNGALRMFGAPDTARIVRSGYLSPKTSVGPARRRLADPAGQVLFDGPPGSAILFAPCRCLHRAGIPAPGRTRGMVQLTFDVAPRPVPHGDLLAAMPPDRNVLEARPVT